MKLNQKMLKLGLFSLALTALTPINPSWAVSFYNLTDLGTLNPEGVDTRANALNNQGQIVGRSRIGSGTPNSGFIWENGVINTLPLTGIKNGTETITLPGRGGLARSINESGIVVGAGDETAGPTDRALMWTPNASGGYDLAIYDFGGVESYFIDINNQNQIAGYHIPVTGKQNAIYWENNTRLDLPSLGGDRNFGLGINDNAQIVGYVDTDGADNGTNTYAAALWQKDSNGNFVLNNLGTFGATQSFANTINQQGEIVGQLSNNIGGVINSSAFLWQNGIKTDLGSLGGTVGNALSINNQTQVVGFANTANNISHAFLWENGQIFDLNSLLLNGSGWQLTQATGINDQGQIVGYGTYTNSSGESQTRAFLLQSNPSSQSVPESDTNVGIIAVGCFGLIRIFHSLLLRKI